jgi:hypothetical protein
LRALCRLLLWFVVVAVPIGLYGEATAPLLLVLAADVAVGHLILRTLAPSPPAAATR